MDPQIGSEQVIHARLTQARRVAGGKDAVGVQATQRRIVPERVEPQIRKIPDADCRKGPGDGDLFHLLQERIGVAQVARELEELRQMAKGQVSRPIHLRTARRGRGNATHCRDPVLTDVAADRELAEMIEQVGCPKRGTTAKWRSIEGKFVAGEFVNLAQHDKSVVGFRPEWRGRNHRASLLGLLPATPEGAQSRVLWVGPPEDVPVPGWPLTDGLVYALADEDAATMRERWHEQPTRAEGLVAQDIDLAASSATDRFGRLIGPMGVRFVLVPVTPAATPASTRSAINVSKFVASPQANVATPTISMQSAIKRVLLNMSAKAPSTGCTSAYGNVKPVESNAAVVVVTFRSCAICGMTGSTERMKSVVAKMTNAMRLSTRPMETDCAP